MSRVGPKHGFTLIEVMVATAVVGILTLVILGVVRNASWYSGVSAAYNHRMVLAQAALDDLLETVMESNTSATFAHVVPGGLVLASPRDRQGQFNFSVSGSGGGGSDGPVWQCAVVFVLVGDELRRYEDYTPRDYDDANKWRVVNYTQNVSLTLGDGTVFNFNTPVSGAVWTQINPNQRARVLLDRVSGFTTANTPPVSVQLQFLVPRTDEFDMTGTARLEGTAHGYN